VACNFARPNGTVGVDGCRRRETCKQGLAPDRQHLAHILAPQEARVWFDQALEFAKTMPESPSTLEQALNIRFELFSVLLQLGEIQQGPNRLRDAEPLAERLNDDSHRGRLFVGMTGIQEMLGELDEALRLVPARWRAPRRLEAPIARRISSYAGALLPKRA
jgi:hypothetical protein